jgi:hypothetical protein
MMVYVPSIGGTTGNVPLQPRFIELRTAKDAGILNLIYCLQEKLIGKSEGYASRGRTGAAQADSCAKAILYAAHRTKHMGAHGYACPILCRHCGHAHCG